MINSKDKGARGERMFCALCKEEGFGDVHRSQQYCGKVEDGEADVVGLPYMHVEVKNRERLTVHEAMTQAVSESKMDELPVVAWHKSRNGWLMIMKSSDWFKMYRSYIGQDVRK